MLRNSLAHLSARIAALAAGIVIIPLVTLTLGAEALGLVGIYAALQAIIALFDLGLPVAANHRLAVLIGRGAPPVQQAEVVRTLEVAFWSLAILFLVAGFGMRGLLAHSWLNVVELSRDEVNAALALMIAAAAVRFPVSFYTNVLFAYDRHLFPNAVTAASAILRVLFSFVALVQFHVGIVGFFVIQLAVSAVESALLTAAVWFGQRHRRVAPRWQVCRDIGMMAGGLTLVSITAVVLSQIDKVIASRLLSLSDFGLYSAGYALAAGVVALSYPPANAVFPQLSRSLDASRDRAAGVVAAASELTIAIVVPLACVMIAQTEPVLRFLFLVKPAPEGLVAILPLMLLGGLAQVFVTLPHLFQVAAGRVATVAWINTGFIVPYGLGMLAAAYEYGVVGAAAAFAAFNGLRLLCHWIVLLTGPDRVIWLRMIGMTLAAVAAGIGLAAVPAWAGLSNDAAMIAAVMTVPVLTMLMLSAMPKSRARLFDFYRSAATRYRR